MRRTIKCDIFDTQEVTCTPEIIEILKSSNDFLTTYNQIMACMEDIGMIILLDKNNITLHSIQLLCYHYNVKMYIVALDEVFLHKNVYMLGIFKGTELCGKLDEYINIKK